MSEAVFGLVGVLLGGFITAGAQWLRDRRIRRRERLTSARLVASELGDAEAAITFAERNGRWWPNELHRTAWEAYAPALSAEISMREWLVVLAAEDAVARIVRTREAFGGALATIAAGSMKDLEGEKAKVNKGIDWLSVHSYNFPWWKVHRRVGLQAGRRQLHREGPEVPS